MRSVMNISLPRDLMRDIENGVKAGRYASKSEFMRDLVRSWKEAEFLKVLQKSEEEFKRGKWKVLKSLKDLR